MFKCQPQNTQVHSLLYGTRGSTSIPLVIQYSHVRSSTQPRAVTVTACANDDKSFFVPLPLFFPFTSLLQAVFCRREKPISKRNGGHKRGTMMAGIEWVRNSDGRTIIIVLLAALHTTAPLLFCVPSTQNCSGETAEKKTQLIYLYAPSHSTSPFAAARS